MAFGVASMIVSRCLRPNRPNPVKLSAYECGNDPVRLPRGEKFSVKFYVVAMLFIIFDVETIFLFPWAVSFRALGLFGLIEMAVFIGLVFVAYVYVWRKGGLDWTEDTVDARGGGGCIAEDDGSRLTKRRSSVPVERVEGVQLGKTPEEVEDEVRRGVLLTSLDKAVGWARKQSMWPATFGLACCAIEMMSAGAGKYDLSRWGMELFRASPRQADLMIVAGRVSPEDGAGAAPDLRPDARAALGDLHGRVRVAGGMFTNYAIVQGVDTIVPVDIYVPGLSAEARDADVRHPEAAGEGADARSPSDEPRARSPGGCASGAPT